MRQLASPTLPGAGGGGLVRERGSGPPLGTAWRSGVRRSTTARCPKRLPLVPACGEMRRGNGNPNPEPGRTGTRSSEPPDGDPTTQEAAMNRATLPTADPTLLVIVLRPEDLARPLDQSTTATARAATGRGWHGLLDEDPTWEDAEWR